MATGALGLNILGQGISAENVVAYARHIQSRTCVVIDEWKLAAQLLPVVPRVIFRLSDDDNAHLRFDPVQFADTLHHVAPAGCLLYGGNEPGSSTLQELNDWTLRFVERCKQVGRKPVIFNNYVYHPIQGYAGWLTLKPAVMAAKAIGGSVGIHVYFDETIDASAGAFAAISHVRAACGADVFVDVTEYGCAVDYDPYKGYQTVYSPDVHNQQCEIGIRRYGAYNTDWQLFVAGNWNATPTFDVMPYPHEVRNKMAALNAEPRTAPAPPVTSTCPDPATLGAVIDGVVTKVNASWVNIRKSCNASSEDIGDLRLGDKVRFRSNATAKLNGYTWYRITSPVTGWVAAVANDGTVISIIQPSTPLPGVYLDVPYFSQLSASANDFNNDCLAACCRMLAEYAWRSKDLKPNTLLTVNDFAHKIMTADTPQPVSDGTYLLNGMGIGAVQRADLTLANIRAELIAGRPPLMLCVYKYIYPADSFDGGHFVVVTGINDENVICHDPYKRGSNVAVPLAQFIQAISDMQPYNSGSYIGITLN